MKSDKVVELLQDWLNFAADVQPHCAAGTEQLENLRSRTRFVIDAELELPDVFILGAGPLAASTAEMMLEHNIRTVIINPVDVLPMEPRGLTEIYPMPPLEPLEIKLRDTGSRYSSSRLKAGLQMSRRERRANERKAKHY